jgi:hypothetical protein
MSVKSPGPKREILNQLINFFWTILCFAPVVWFWIRQGVNIYFYLFTGISIVVGLLPEKILNLFMLSSGRKLYEKLGVKQVRKWVQNGDIIRDATRTSNHSIINSISMARRYLKTIAMYERYHWVCFSFFLLTAIFCFFEHHPNFALLITEANILYNLSSILLQQYNKIRIKRIIS